MKTQSDLSKDLAQAQKRLRYWTKLLKEKSEDAKTRESIQGLLNTCGLLISKAIKAQNESDQKEALERLAATENTLEAIFSSARLMTHSSGTASVEHLSTAWDK